MELDNIVVLLALKLDYLNLVYLKYTLSSLIGKLILILLILIQPG